MIQKLPKAQIKLLKTRKSACGFEFEIDCPACEYEMRREFAGEEDLLIGLDK